MSLGKELIENKSIPGWAKGVILVGGGLVIYLVGKSIWDAVKQAKAQAAAKQESTDAVGTLNQLAANGVTPTATDAQFESWSNTIATAVGGCYTDSDTVTTIISQLKNDADIYKLIAVFGTRTVKGCLLASNKNYSLSAILNYELSSQNIITLNSILASKNISFRFS